MVWDLEVILKLHLDIRSRNYTATVLLNIFSISQLAYI